MSLSSSGGPSMVQKMTLKDLVKGMEEEQKTKLAEEVKYAVSQNLWNNEECNTFIQALIKSGSVQEAKKDFDDKVPEPTDGGSGNIADSARDNSYPHENGDFSSFHDMVLYAAKCANENEDTEHYTIILEYDDGDIISYTTKKEGSFDDLLLQVRKKTPPLPDVTFNWRKKSETKIRSVCWGPDVKKSQVDRFFDKFVEDLAALQLALPPLEPLVGSDRLKPMKGSNRLEPLEGVKLVQFNENYVHSKPEDAQYLFEMQSQADKTFAIVVAGESGSGKSVFACLHSINKGYLPIYLVYAPNESKDVKMSGSDQGEYPSTVLPKKPRLDEYPWLNAVLQAAISDATGNENDINNLYRLKSKVNISRDKWAKSVLETMIENLKKNDLALTKWLNGTWSYGSRPSKVAIIIDEATDVHLVEGLVSTVRDTTVSFSHLAKHKVQLVLVGVGLDVIREKGRIGSNPAYSKLVTIVGPNISQVVERESDVDDSIGAALRDGLIARVLKTNTRMFFRGVLPTLQLPMHRVDDESLLPPQKKVRLDQRLIGIASTLEMMDYSVRYYVNQNSLGNLNSRTRSSLLSQSFLYHLVKSMEDLSSRINHAGLQEKVGRELEIARGFEQYRKIREDPTRNIFAKGLARKAGTANDGTSNALKFLACFGLTCRVRPTFGEEFEEITALHYMRYGEVKGYAPFRITLRHPWPPPALSKGATIHSLNEISTTQKETEIDNLNRCCGSFEWKAGKWCIVFSQGTANAQGGDVFGLMLDLHTKKGILDCIQCKNYSKRPTGNEKCPSWWKSLGVDSSSLDSDLFADLSPDKDESDELAAYSFRGLDSFRGVLQEWLQSFGVTEVVFGDRILAMSFPTPSTFPVPKNEECRVWFHEMLEPTISVLPLPQE